MDNITASDAVDFGFDPRRVHQCKKRNPFAMNCEGVALLLCLADSVLAYGAQDITKGKTCRRRGLDFAALVNTAQRSGRVDYARSE